MRTWELVQLGAVATAVVVPVLLSHRLKRGRMALVLVAAMAAQLVVEGFRWQLIPLELATVGLAAGDLVWEDRRVRGWPRVRRGLVGVPSILLLAVLPAALPIPELPPPTGQFEIGTTDVVLVDLDREEIYGSAGDEAEEAETEEEEEEPIDPRLIVVQAWYPATVPDGSEPQVWNPDWDVVGPAMARRLGFPGFFLDHVADLPSHAHSEAEPLPGRLPVVIYSHGWTGFRTIALSQMETLASHGYLVIAADHAYGAVATRFPDGTVVELDTDALPDEEEVGTEDRQEASRLLVETFAADIALVVDALEQGPSGPFGRLAEHADLDRIGVYGHSTGGGAAVRFCLEDERCDAVLGMDAWVEPVPDRLVAGELEVASLFMRSDGWRGDENDGRLRGLAERSPATSYWMALLGAGHNDFVLTPAFSPIADRLGLKGPIDGDRVVRIIDDYLVGFFDRYLYDVGGAVLDEPPPPEVDLETLP